ncbi:MAG: multicopper oxidase domain-containing protein [Dehalococcoidia bacterium]
MPSVLPHGRPPTHTAVEPGPPENAPWGRRRFLRRLGGVGLALGAGAVGLRWATDGAAPAGRGRAQSPDAYAAVDPRDPATFVRPLALPGAAGGLLGFLDLTAPLTINAGAGTHEYFDGRQTPVSLYQAEVGGQRAVNPILRVRTGDTVTARLVNTLTEPTIIHWHGLHVDAANDGHPAQAVPPGGVYDYRFTVRNRSGLYWYHPHPDMLTGKQAYQGLAGLLLVDDDDELRLRAALDLEPGVTDIPLVIQDRRFTADGRLTYVSTPMDQFMGFTGDTVIVNHTINPALDVDGRLYHFRVLNGSNARTYRLAFRDGATPLPFRLIGTDGGLLAEPVDVRELFLSPGERADLLLDLRAAAAGDTVMLSSLSFDPMHNEMGGMGMGMGPGPMGPMGGHQHGPMMGPASRLDDGAGFHLLKLTVRRRTAYDLAVPARLSEPGGVDTRGGGAPDPALDGHDGVVHQRPELGSCPRPVPRTPRRHRDLGVRERHEQHAPPRAPPRLPIARDRTARQPGQIRPLVVDAQGRLASDLGWKDTVLVWPGETVRAVTRFAHPFDGAQQYLLHCHVLEHEDAGMMVNWRVVDGE